MLIEMSNSKSWQGSEVEEGRGAVPYRVVPGWQRRRLQEALPGHQHLRISTITSSQGNMLRRCVYRTVRETIRTIRLRPCAQLTHIWTWMICKNKTRMLIILVNIQYYSTQDANNIITKKALIIRTWSQMDLYTESGQPL